MLDIFCCCRSIQAYTEQEIKHLRSSSCEKSVRLSPSLTLIQEQPSSPFLLSTAPSSWSCRLPKAAMARLTGQTVAGCQQSWQGKDWEKQSPSSATATCLQPLEGKNNNNHNLNKPTETEQDCARATLPAQRIQQSWGWWAVLAPRAGSRIFQL